MLKRAWYCAATSNELVIEKPLGRKLLGEHLALYRAQDGRVHAVGAVCPHRGADLARGRVRGDQLQCPMHGWCFDSTGRCVGVPSQPAGEKIPPKARTPVWTVREQQGVIWLWGGDDAPDFSPPWHSEWEEGADRARYNERPRLWKSSFVNVMENAIDTTHIPFVHLKTLGADSRQLYPRQQIVVDDNQRGFWGEDSAESPWRAPHDVPLRGGLLKRLLGATLGLGRISRERYRVDLGGSVFYKVEYENGTWDVLVAHSTPCDEHHTWFFGISIRTRALHLAGRLFQSWFARSLCDEDGSQLGAMLSNDASLLPAPVSVVGDEPLLVFRRLQQQQQQQRA